MADAKLTIAGMYNYQPAMFDEMALPIVPTAEMLNIPEDMIISTAMQEIIAINLPDLIGKICLDSAGFSTLYMDADLMKILIGVWSRTRLPTWQRLYNTLFYKYNPIWNKNYYTDKIRSGNKTNDTEFTNNKDNRNTYTEFNRSRNLDMTKGFDAGAFTPDFRVDPVHPLSIPAYYQDQQHTQPERVTETDNTNSNSNNQQHVRTTNTMNVDMPSLPNYNEIQTAGEIVTPSLNATDANFYENTHGDISQNNGSNAGVMKEKQNDSDTETKHEYGNIGIMTTQQMLEAEQKLALFNIYEIISKEFIKKFCIMVY